MPPSAQGHREDSPFAVSTRVVGKTGADSANEVGADLGKGASAVSEGDAETVGAGEDGGLVLTGPGAALIG